MTNKIKIALPTPDSDGAHAIETPVESILTEPDIPDNQAVIIIDDKAASLTPKQCFRLSDHFNTLGESLLKYHNDGADFEE